MPRLANARSFNVRFGQSRGQSGMALVQSIQYQEWQFIHVKSRHITFMVSFLSRSRSSSPWSAGQLKSCGNQRRYELLVKAEEMLRAVTITTEGSRTIELVHGVIKGTVGFTQLRRHGIDIVEIGKR